MLFFIEGGQNRYFYKVKESKVRLAFLFLL